MSKIVQKMAGGKVLREGAARLGKPVPAKKGIDKSKAKLASLGAGRRKR